MSTNSEPVRVVLERAAAMLAGAGLEAPRVDAELLVAHVLGVSRGKLFLAGDLTGEQQERLAALVEARVRHEPLQYLTGSAPFRYVELAVGAGVFIPRPETELLVEWGLSQLDQRPHLVVDLCAGSGAIALSVQKERSNSRVYAVELAPAALEWLRRNASGTSVTVVAADVLDPGPLADLAGRVDLVLANPPYVPESSAGALPVEVTAHDPYTSVFGGLDGLTVIRPLIRRIADLLRPGGVFGLEHDETHGGIVPELVRADGRFVDVKLHHDLPGRPRFTTATRTGVVPSDGSGWQDGAP